MRKVLAVATLVACWIAGPLGLESYALSRNPGGGDTPARTQASPKASPQPGPQASPPTSTKTNPPASTQTSPPASTQTSPPASTKTNPPASTQTSPPASTKTNPPANAKGLTTTQGDVKFDAASRTLTITDVVISSDAQPSFTFKIGRITATGVDTSQNRRFAADRIEITNGEISATLPVPGGLKLAYKMPSVIVSGYSGPAALLRTPDPASPLDMWRVALEHFAALDMASVTMPSMTVSLTPADPNVTKGLGPIEYTYSDVAIGEVHGGKIASMTAARLSLAGKIAGPQGTLPMIGVITNLAMRDFDAGAMLAVLDPAHAKDDTYHRAYGRVTTGAYTVAVGPDVKFQIDSMSLDNVGLRPAKLQIANLLAIVGTLPAPGTQPSPAQIQQLLGTVGDLYEGIGIGRFEMRGIAVTAPGTTVKVGAARLAKLENGRIAELAVEDVDIGGPSPAKVGHFALKGLDFAGLVRVGTQFQPGEPPSPDKFAALLHLIEGVELRGFTSTAIGNKPINVESADISWGNFVGPLPSKLHVGLKMSGPLNKDDGDPFKMLFATGITRAAIGLDLGLGWNESRNTLSLTPGMAALDKVGAFSAKASLGNVTREMFSIDPFELMASAAVVEAGPIEIVLRDAGGVDLAIGQYARQHNQSPDQAREAILANIRQSAAAMAAANPDVTTVADAFARFVATPNGTLTVKVTPKGSVPLSQLIEAAKANPPEMLSQFRLEATVGK